jgi:N-methylhydantoinase B
MEGRVYRGEAVLDDDGHAFRDVYMRAKVTKRGSDLTVDLSESHPQVIGFENSSYPNMRSAVAMALARRCRRANGERLHRSGHRC